MAEKKLVFEVRPDGTVKSEAFGFTGAACTNASAVFEQALQAEIVSRTKKAEAHQTQAVSGGAFNVLNN